MARVITCLVSGILLQITMNPKRYMLCSQGLLNSLVIGAKCYAVHSCDVFGAAERRGSEAGEVVGRAAAASEIDQLLLSITSQNHFYV